MKLEELQLLSEARALLDSPNQPSKLDDSDLVCECVCISAGEIREYLEEKKELDLELLKIELKLGSGCSSCTKTFKDWKSRI